MKVSGFVVAGGKVYAGISVDMEIWEIFISFNLENILVQIEEIYLGRTSRKSVYRWVACSGAVAVRRNSHDYGLALDSSY